MYNNDNVVFSVDFFKKKLDAVSISMHRGSTPFHVKETSAEPKCVTYQLQVGLN